MTGLCRGLAHILESETVNQAHVFGVHTATSAQYFVRQYPAKACSLYPVSHVRTHFEIRETVVLTGKLIPAFQKSCSCLFSSCA